MKHQDVLNELRNALAELVAKVEAASAMQLHDINRLAEGVVLGLFREIYGLPNLRNLNATARKNFPGIDLADDTARIAVQVTATPTLDKVKDTVTTFLRHDLNKRFDRLVIYILTHKQNSYSQSAIESIAKGHIDFQVGRDVLDFRDILGKAVDLPPSKVLKGVEVLRIYNQGGTPLGLAETDFDPSSETEHVALNLVEVFFPSLLYVGDLLPEIKPEGPSGHAHRGRKAVRDYLTTMNLRAPSDFEVNARRIITFHKLDERPNPFELVTDIGTLTPLKPHEFYSIDEDHERVFKSLLRLCLQQKLHKHRVLWKHEDGLFIFVPRQDEDLERKETWTGQRQASRTVYEKKINKKDPNKVFVCKHFAFGVDFVRVEDQWFAALTPDWYFSYGDGYRKSLYADEHLSWLKRKEINRTITDNFRFLVSYLEGHDTDDLF
ncbi:MAG: SMEK domain-containing protein [Gammaproteobacteria bacterium]